jgi:hypothetical protein
MATHQLRIDEPSTTKKSGIKKWSVIGLIVLGCLVVAGAALLAGKWPFTQARVIERLQEATATTVQIGSLREEYFPHPGCVAKQVTFQERGGHQPLMSIQKARGPGSGRWNTHHAPGLGRRLVSGRK